MGAHPRGGATGRKGLGGAAQGQAQARSLEAAFQGALGEACRVARAEPQVALSGGLHDDHVADVGSAALSLGEEVLGLDLQGLRQPAAGRWCGFDLLPVLTAAVSAALALFARRARA